MFVDWIIQKTGMVFAFFVLFGVFYQVINFYDRENTRREAGIAVQELADQIATVANFAPEYSAGNALSKRVHLPEEIHGIPYTFAIDEERQHIRITLIGEGVSEFAILPKSATVNGAGRPCLIKEGFNSNGEISVGANISGMNRSKGISVTKSRGENYTLKISVLM